MVVVVVGGGGGGTGVVVTCPMIEARGRNISYMWRGLGGGLSTGVSSSA